MCSNYVRSLNQCSFTFLFLLSVLKIVLSSGLLGGINQWHSVQIRSTFRKRNCLFLFLSLLIAHDGHIIYGCEFIFRNSNELSNTMTFHFFLGCYFSFQRLDEGSVARATRLIVGIYDNDFIAASGRRCFPLEKCAQALEWEIGD